MAVGAAVCATLLASLILLVAGLFSGGPLPIPGWPDAARQGEADGGQVLPSPAAPTGSPGSSTAPRPQPAPASPTPTPPVVPTATRGPLPSPTAVNQPGQGDEHRATPHGPKPDKSHGKPA